MVELSNILTDNLWTILFYIVSSIILIGTLFQLFLQLPGGEKFYILIVKKYKPLYILTYILQLLSIVYFPAVAFYLFTVFYVNRQKTLF